MLSESELNLLVQQIPLPTSQGRIRVHNFAQTNLFVYRDINGGLGILLSNVGVSPEVPEFRNIQFRMEETVQVYHSNDTSSQLADVFAASFTEQRFDYPIILILEYMLYSVDGEHYTSNDLIDVILLFKELLAGPPKQLSMEEKIGIWGELWFIRRTFRTAENENQREKVIQAWENSLRSVSDFNFCDSSVVVEVKTTVRDSRVHMISSVEQLSDSESPDGVEQYVASMACRVDETPAGWTIRRLIDSIITQIETERVRIFFTTILETRGWNDGCTDICLVIRPGVPLALFKKEKIPTVLPLAEGVIQAQWQVILDEQNKESDPDLIISGAINL